MKRLFSCLLIAVLCISMIPAMAVSASEQEIVRYSFDNGTSLNTVNSSETIAAAKGFLILGTPTLLDCEVRDHALLIRSSDSDAFFDLQLWLAPSIPKVQQDATLSFKLKPQTADAYCGNLVSFRDSSQGFDSFTFGFSGSDLLLSNSPIGTLSTSEWNQIDLEFHYDTAVSHFDKIYILLNGEHLSTYSVKQTVATLDHFRMCRYNTRGSYLLDELTYSYGITTQEQTGEDLPDEVDDLIASIPDSKKHKTVVIESFDFNDVDSVNTSQDALNDFGGMVALNAPDVRVKNKEVLYRASDRDGFIDFQFYNLTQFPRVDEDFILSMKIKPLTSDLSIGHFMDFRYSGGDWVSKSVSISDCKIRVGGKDVGTLPLNEYSLLEFVFHYSPVAKSTYESYDVLLNGECIATYYFSVEAVSIDHFRMFRYLTGSFALDDISFAYGTNSLIYQGEKIHWLDEKKTNVTIDPQMPDDLPPKAEDPQPSVEPNDTKEEPSQSSASTNDEKKNATRGCRSAICAGMPILLLIGGSGIAFRSKSKKHGGKS